MAGPLYLDYNATTPVDPDVLEAMLPYFTEQFGNASSRGHAYGWAADEAVGQARERVATLLDAPDPEHITFTSGATEALNAAIRGVAAARGGRHILTVATEHQAVLAPCRTLERQGFDLTYLEVDEQGRVSAEAVEKALRDDTVLVAVMWANNETGVLHPVEEIGRRLQAHEAAFLVDATQAVAKTPVNVEHIDLLACSGHKFYGPKGVGALYQRRPERLRLAPLIEGGGQQQGQRGGTVNVPGAVGMGAAAEKAQRVADEEPERLRALRDRFEAALQAELGGIRINGQRAPRLPQTSSMTFEGLEADRLMRKLRGLAISSGSACASGDPKPSHVLRAMGLSRKDARATLRFSLGRFTSDEDIDAAIEQILDGAGKLQRRTTVHT